MKIIFLQDYIGRETAMQPYKKGDIAELPFSIAAELVKYGIADIYEPAPKQKAVKNADA